MSDPRLSRRNLVAAAAVLPLAAATASIPAQAHQHNQPEMRAALASLEAALAALQRAGAGKGGHRAEAIRLTRAAIEQVKQGIAFANANR